jgi:tetratricopeptide (TPR) repeat protein
MEVAELLRQGVIPGGYTLERELGRGGMGVVYLVRVARKHQRRALKVILPELAANERARNLFLREMANCRALDHPNMVHTYDDGYAKGVCYLIMEYCEGGSLDRLLGAKGVRPVEEALRIIRDVLSGLEAAHTAVVPNVALEEGEVGEGVGLVHRDLKPHNVFLAGDGDSTALVDARRHETGATWVDPRGWLQQAYRESGTDPQTIGEYWPVRMGNRRAMALADLRALEEARRLLEPAAAGDPGRTYSLGLLRSDIALVLASLGDSPGAIREMGVCIDLLGPLAGPEAARDLAVALIRLAIELRKVGRREESIATSRRCIGLCEGPAEAGETEFRLQLGSALLTLGNTVGDPRAALEHYDRALLNLEGLEEPEALMKVLAAKATAQEAIGARDEAKATWEKADAILARLIEQGRTDLRLVLGWTRLNRAKQTSDFSQRLNFAREAIDALDPLVAEEGRSEFAGDLGQAYFQAGMSLEFLSRVREAMDAYSQSSRWLSVAVLQEGQPDLTDDLAQSLDFESALTRSLGDPEVAVDLARKAVGMWENLVEVDGHERHYLHLAEALAKLGANLSEAGRFDEGAGELDRSIALFRRHQGRLSDVEEKGMIAAAMMQRAIVSRRASDLEGAIQGHTEALELVRSLDDPQNRHTAASISQSLSNALSDAGDHRRSQALIDDAILRWEALVHAGEANRREDLVAALQNRTNKLIRLGMLSEACKAADRALEIYERLVSDEKRDDLAFEMGRLLVAAGQAHRGLFRPEEALPYFERSLALLETSRPIGPFRELAAQRETLEQLVRELRELIDAKPADYDRWFAKAKGKAELARMLAEQGDTFPAQLALHNAIAIAMQLDRVSGDWRFVEDAARWSLEEGAFAMHARLDPASESAFRLAVSLADRLVEVGASPDRIEHLARAYLGLVSFLKLSGRDDEAQATVDGMAARLKALDPVQEARWSQEADSLLAEF